MAASPGRLPGPGEGPRGRGSCHMPRCAPRKPLGVTESPPRCGHRPGWCMANRWAQALRPSRLERPTSAWGHQPSPPPHPEEGQVPFPSNESRTEPPTGCTLRAAECSRRLLPHGRPDHWVKVRDDGWLSPGNREALHTGGRVSEPSVPTPPRRAGSRCAPDHDDGPRPQVRPGEGTRRNVAA